MPVFFFGEFRQCSLAASGSNWKAAKTRISPFWGGGVRASSQADSTWRVSRGRVIRAEGDDDALGFLRLWFRHRRGGQASAAEKARRGKKSMVLATFAANAGFEKFVAPVGLAKGGAGAGDGGVEERRGRRWRKSAMDGWEERNSRSLTGDWMDLGFGSVRVFDRLAIGIGFGMTTGEGPRSVDGF